MIQSKKHFTHQRQRMNRVAARHPAKCDSEFPIFLGIPLVGDQYFGSLGEARNMQIHFTIPSILGPFFIV